MSTVLLINPWQYSEKEVINRVWPPLCLANCAALLRERGLDVSIVDANAEKLRSEEVARRVREMRPGKVFITSTPIDRWQCPYVDLKPFIECSDNISKVCKEIGAKFYVTGAHGTVKPETVLDMAKADAVIIGEPELTVLELCEKNYSDVSGICYKENDEVLIKPRVEFLDLNKLPLPAFDLLSMEKYFYELLGKDFALLETSRGCPFNCIFCLKKMYGSSYRRKSVEKVAKEIEYVIEKGVKNVYFIDLEFTVDRNFVLELCDFLSVKRKEGCELNWCCQTRADTVDKEMLERMHDAGCKLIHFGIESGSPRMTDVMNKGATLGRIEEGIRAVMDAGIETTCFFMFGLPTENIGEATETINFAKRLNPTYASFHVSIPYTGTAFGDSCNFQGQKQKQTPKDLFFPLCDPSRDYEELRGVAKKAYIQFYLRPSYVLNAIKRNPRLLAKQFKLFWRYTR